MSNYKDEWFNEYYKGNNKRSSQTDNKSGNASCICGKDHGKPVVTSSISFTPEVGEDMEFNEADNIVFALDLYDIQDELADVLLSKHEDYGSDNIALAPGGALNGLRVRMHDKLSRLNNLLDSGKSPNHESIRDTLVDLANYATIAIMVEDGLWDNK